MHLARLNQDFHYILMKSAGLGGTLDRRGLCVGPKIWPKGAIAAAAGDLLGERARARSVTLIGSTGGCVGAFRRDYRTGSSQTHTHNRAIILIENIIHYPSDKTRT